MDAMEEDETLSVDDVDSEPGSIQNVNSFSKKSSSGITLVLPSLKSLKQAKSGHKKAKSSLEYHLDTSLQEKKAPRHVKLKPLKEVLTKLINQIKKKDDYAFFLHPVDPVQVPGYADVIKTPMDLGTIGAKVARGRYRSLEEFANDFRLVTSNAKQFNPPGTIYYTEAERIEAYGLDHIAKAASTVIQYETDWNIEVEKDDDPGNINIEDDADLAIGTPVDANTPGSSYALATTQGQLGMSRRSTRLPAKKASASSGGSKTISESIDAEGRLPGSKDGLGAFQPGSDWAKTMLDLKIKGKRYKTKKERLRIEKEGPPFRTDGSLDYYEMEDPFSVLCALAPDAPTRPLLTPIYTSISLPGSQPRFDPSHSQSQTPQPITSFPIPVNTPLSRPYAFAEPGPSSAKRRHWSVVRNANARRVKERDDEREGSTEVTEWKSSREPHAVDFGSFALLAGEIAEEIKRRAVVGDDEEQTLSIIRESMDCREAAKRLPRTTSDSDVYFNTSRATEAEDYIRDVVYGGLDGFAYARSLAEFVAPPEEFMSPSSSSSLGVPLTKWVEENVLDPLTDGRHALLRGIDTHTASCNLPNAGLDAVSAQVSRSLREYPIAEQALQSLLQIRTHKIDMGALIKTPSEIYASEEEWLGKQLKTSGQLTTKDEMAVDQTAPQGSDALITYDNNSTTQSSELESPEQMNHVFAFVTNAILEYDRKVKAHGDNRIKSDVEEDAVVRNIRLNLLALAKRAPLDTIARLPVELVPEHIRQYVPTLSASS